MLAGHVVVGEEIPFQFGPVAQADLVAPGGMSGDHSSHWLSNKGVGGARDGLSQKAHYVRAF